MSMVKIRPIKRDVDVEVLSYLQDAISSYYFKLGVFNILNRTIDMVEQKLHTKLDWNYIRSTISLCFNNTYTMKHLLRLEADTTQDALLDKYESYLRTNLVKIIE